MIKMREVVMYRNKIYSIPRTEDESRETYLERVGYIIKRLNDVSDTDADPKESSTVKKAIQMSYIWRNSKIYGMVYPAAINNKI